jgi:hypothetical protein
MSELRFPGWLLLLVSIATAGCAPTWVDGKVREANTSLPAAFVADQASAAAPGEGSVGARYPFAGDHHRAGRSRRPSR